GSKFYVPVEVIPYAITLVEQKLKDLGASEVVLRNAVKKDGPIVTDNGNFVFDAKFNISDPIELEAKINSIPGVVENGIFSKNSGVVPERAIIAADSGVTVKTR
ncbi:MAG: ribose-5-phosphate isomerase A, partial [Spirochaetia bacterium]|nr:ribose-5-phosphate isomerase A [Spirochaetia bacterium]